MKTRIISAAVGLVVAVVVLIFAHTWFFNLFMAALTVGALYELFRAVGLVRYTPECCACFGFAALDCLIGMVHRHNVLAVLNRELFLLLLGIALLVLYLKNNEKYNYSVPFTFLGMTVGVTFSFGCLLQMPTVFTEYGVFAVVLTLAGAWLADSGAYFAGTFFGKTKLCPVISPKKTVEGLIGGTVCNGVFLLIIAGVYNSLINKDVHVNLIAVFIAGMLCSVIGLVGDLGASVIKRQAGIKDYGNIMPGHGGIMDRFDSVLTVTPFMFWMFTSGLLVTMK